MADKLHVTRQTLSRWENNLSYPNLDTLVNLSEFLAVPLDILQSTYWLLLIEPQTSTRVCSCDLAYLYELMLFKNVQ